jgi:hypothetical protein
VVFKKQPVSQDPLQPSSQMAGLMNKAAAAGQDLKVAVPVGGGTIFAARGGGWHGSGGVLGWSAKFSLVP